jgi:hypothetical protein
MTTLGSDARRLNGLHRIGSLAIGIVLWVFGGLGFTNNLEFFSTSGTPVLGMSTNGLLSAVSLVFGTVLIAAAVRGGRLASTVSVAVGVGFLLSGIANVLVLNGPYNVLAFGMSNVVFSLVAGLILLTLGAYGRFSGRLPDTSPYAAHAVHSGHAPVDADEGLDRDQQLPTGPADIAAARSLAETERLVATGAGTEAQRQALAELDGIRDLAARRAAWRARTDPS